MHSSGVTHHLWDEIQPWQVGEVWPDCLAPPIPSSITLGKSKLFGCYFLSANTPSVILHLYILARTVSLLGTSDLAMSM